MSGEPAMQERESMDFDVVIVGAGPAGLAAAIRIKQINSALSVVVLEKGAEIGAHILSGAVIDPAGLDRLIPEWRDDSDQPLSMRVREDRFLLMGRRRSITVPHWAMRLMPPLMHNDGSYIGSLGELCRWLGARAEALGVDIYPGFAAQDLLYDESGAVRGVATGDMGVGRDGWPGPGYARGMALLGKYVLIAEGARGSLSRQLIERYRLSDDREPQKFGLGLKEVWQVTPDKHEPGLVQHSFGWPLDNGTGGGSFLYHYGENLVAIGFVVHLDYDNPHLSPFEEFQRFKTHPAIRPLLEGGQRLSYGARAITEGGWQSVPRLSFPGGALLGCAAGFVNVPRIKGSHNAILSGIAAAESVAAAIASGRAGDELVEYETGWRHGPIGRDLLPVRNVKPLWFKFGTAVGVLLGGLDMWFTTVFSGWSPFGTLRHSGPDHLKLKTALAAPPIAYPRPDGVVSFDLMSSVFLSSTNHSEDQPVHLKVGDPALQRESEFGVYGGPSERYCPAGVYEWIDGEGRKQLSIHAQNCIHCKTCDIKDPNQNITWVPPQGGEGPGYRGM